MKRFAVLVFTIILCFVFLGAGKEEPPIDFDLSAFNRSITYAQMIQVCNAPENYDGKIFRVNGKFNYSEMKEVARIIFSDKSGCCELAMQFCPENTLKYPDDYPQLYSDITITAKLVVDRDDPDMPFWFADATLEWEKEGIKK